MNVNLSILGLIEIVCSLVTGVTILFVTYKLLQLFAKKYIKLTEVNTAYRIFMAGTLFGVGHIISGVIQPILTSFRLLAAQT